VQGPANVSYLSSRDVRIIAPNTENAYTMRFGFTSWNNNNGSPYADYLHLRSYSDSSGGADNLVMFLKSGIGMRIWQQSFGSGTAYSSYADVLHSSNYSSYRGNQLISPNGASVVAADSAMPDAGHSFIHTLGLGPGGNDGHILGMTWASTTSVYGAQIWVDTDPNNRMAFRSRSSAGVWTGWNEVIHANNYSSYAFPASGGTLNGYLTVSADWAASPYTSALTIIGTYPSITFRGSNSDWEWLQHVDSAGNFHFYGGAGYTANNWSNRATFKTSGQLILKNHSTADSGYDNPLWIWATADSDAIVIQNTTSGGTPPKIYFRDTNGIIQTGNTEIRLRTSNSNASSAYLNGGDWYATGSMRAPIFYDSQDTGYYLDPNSGANLYGGNGSFTIQGTWPQLRIAQNDGTPDASINYDAGSGYRKWNVGPGAGEAEGDEFGFAVYAGTRGTLYSTPLRINALTGYVQIGDRDNPAYQLDVSGYGYFRDNIGVATTPRTDSYKISMGGSIHLNGNSVDYVGSIYMNGGVYIQTNNNRNLLVKSSGAADCGILGRGNGDQFAFQIYGSGGDYGFLDGAWAAWDIRKTVDGAMYMNGNDSYYLQTNSLSRLANGQFDYIGVGQAINTGYRIIVSGDYYANAAGNFWAEGRFKQYRGSGTWHDVIDSGNIGSQSVSSASMLPTLYAGGVQSNPQTYFGQSVGLRVAMTGHWSVWSDTLWINGYAGGDVLQMCALHTLRNGTPRIAISVQASNSSSYGTIYELWSSYNMDAPNKSGTSYYQTNTWMQFNGTYGLYWPSVYGAHFSPNDLTTYTQFALRGSKNGYGGIHDDYSKVQGIMYDSSGNGGVYRETNSRWYWYYHLGNACMGVNTSTTSSSYAMYVNGNIYATGDITAYSDRRKKTNITTIDNALNKVSQLRGVFYDKIDELEKGRQTGVIAQEINEVLPEVVTYAADVDEYGVKYGNIVGVLIEAIKEQQQQIEDLKQQINYLVDNK
jgi:hypothetical protein